MEESLDIYLEKPMAGRILVVPVKAHLLSPTYILVADHLIKTRQRDNDKIEHTFDSEVVDDMILNTPVSKTFQFATTGWTLSEWREINMVILMHEQLLVEAFLAILQSQQD